MAKSTIRGTRAANRRTRNSERLKLAAPQAGIGRFVPKPSTGADRRGCNMHDLVSIVRRRPLASTVIGAIVTHWLLSRWFRWRPAVVTQQFLLPRFDRPTAWRLHPEHPAVHLVEHFPAVSSQLILDPYRKLAAALLQRLGIGAIRGAGVVPCLQVIEQLAA
jgi:hypothetical protein